MDEEMFSFSEILRDYYLERASIVCSDVTVKHYESWTSWAKKNNVRMDPLKFIQALSKLSREEAKERLFAYHMETINGKRVRVDDHFDLIPAAPLKN
ncbi:hypothetical protein [Lactococcus petauri]